MEKTGNWRWLEERDRGWEANEDTKEKTEDPDKSEKKIVFPQAKGIYTPKNSEPPMSFFTFAKPTQQQKTPLNMHSPNSHHPTNNEKRKEGKKKWA